MNYVTIQKSYVTLKVPTVLTFAVVVKIRLPIKKNDMNSGKVMLSVLAGVAVGAAVGVLFAPNKGSKTRKKIAKKKDDYSDLLEEKFDDLIADITDKFDKVKGDVSNFSHKTKAKVRKVKRDIMA